MNNLGKNTEVMGGMMNQAYKHILEKSKRVLNQVRGQVKNSDAIES